MHVFLRPDEILAAAACNLESAAALHKARPAACTCQQPPIFSDLAVEAALFTIILCTCLYMLPTRQPGDEDTALRLRSNAPLQERSLPKLDASCWSIYSEGHCNRRVEGLAHKQALLASMQWLWPYATEYRICNTRCSPRALFSKGLRFAAASTATRSGDFPLIQVPCIECTF